MPPPVGLPPAPLDNVEAVEDESAGELVVPAKGVAVVVLELAMDSPMAGRATAPPAAGKPLRCAALPTAPLVGVAEGPAVWAAAAAANTVENRKASAAKRIVTR